MQSAPSTSQAIRPFPAEALTARVLAAEVTPLPALRFDPEEFMHFVRHENLTDDEARALLREIWKIVVAFVDLGFNLHPIQQAMDNSAFDDAADSPAVISSREDFSEATRHTAAARPNRRARRRKDS